MPHNLDTMMYAGEAPWHHLGTQLDNPATAAEAIVAAGLDWETQKQPVYTGVNRDIRLKDRYVVCRTDRLDQKDGGQLGLVGKNYTPLSNRDAFGFLDPVVGEGAAIYHTAGSLRGGRRVWMLAKLPGHIRVKGDDLVDKYVLLSTSHDGTSSVRIGYTPVRVVCQNTLNLALRGMGGVSIRHGKEVADKIKQAHKLLGLMSGTFDTAGALMQQMAETPVDSMQLRDYYLRVLPAPKEVDEQERLKHQQKIERWTELFEAGEGNQMPGVRHTLWTGYNAITQWADRESYTSRNREPLNTMWFGQADRIKRRAFEVATEELF
ncbi:MAG: DUF932 domain-containing protein [Phycisphaeraceae bacterium]